MTSSTRKQSRRQCGHRRHRQSYQGYRTCYYRTFNVGRATPAQHDAYKTCREWLDNAIDLIKPGVSTDRVAECGRQRRTLAFLTKCQHLACSSVTGSALRFMRGRYFAPGLARSANGDQDRHDVRARDILSCRGRIFRGPHRGGGRCDRHGLQGDFAFPRRGAADRKPLLKAIEDEVEKAGSNRRETGLFWRKAWRECSFATPRSYRWTRALAIFNAETF
jgi:hypothetical protein